MIICCDQFMLRTFFQSINGNTGVSQKFYNILIHANLRHLYRDQRKSSHGRYPLWLIVSWWLVGWLVWRPIVHYFTL